MELVETSSSENDLVGRSRHQAIPFWDEISSFEQMDETRRFPSMNVSWNNINVKIAENERHRGVLRKIARFARRTGHQKTNVDILNNVHGSALSGQIMAVMGPSGAGKTVLMNVLNQTNLRGFSVSGTVRINGQVIAPGQMRRCAAYVQQDELFVGALTVREHLLFHAALRMGSRYSTKEQIERVEYIINELGLKKCENTAIGVPGITGGLSGGERKRLLFGTEILMDPPILFCDEPTSGLDTFLAQQVVQILRDLSRTRNMTIVFSIHQPSSQIVQLFDR
ncbi:hypothetical protein AB6A40_003250 [Gnathostoma spinigerum]|uniref:ABC transporter domain-containing protein n=1 Tax=Gnathostoma spinigerum TaxID=75299 RepID=A0ABD6EGN1_9BILA